MPENVQSTSRQKIALATDLQFVAQGLYYQSPFGSVGPIPPKAGVETTYAIGDFRNPEVGRYELDRTHVLPGLWVGQFTAGGTFTDEDGVVRTYTALRRKELLVSP